MSSGLSPNAQQKWEPIVLRFPEKCPARGPAKNSHKATILFFPHQVRSTSTLPAMSQQHRSGSGDIAKWLIFKTRKLTENNWHVRSQVGSRDESHYVATFTSENQALEWIAGNQSDEWLKERATRRGQSRSR
jgi:hypothetical protein